MGSPIEYLENIYNSLLQGSLKLINAENKRYINSITMGVLNLENPTAEQLRMMELILQISNILYNNCNEQYLVLEDGTYDLLLVHYSKFNNGKYPIGAPPIEFHDSGNIDHELDDTKTLFHFIRYNDEDLYIKDILRNDYDYRIDSYNTLFEFRDHSTFKMNRNTQHNYPQLVGTLDKCKFVLNKQAEDAGVLNDENVQIFERDFIDKHLAQGIITPNEEFTMIAELKYDGISVEADVTDHVIAARTRGDTENNLAADMTSILGGYRFNRMRGKQFDHSIGMKFEAVITHKNLEKLSQLKGKQYANCRNALISIIGSLDGYKYRDLITLVPLASSIDTPEWDRLHDITFLNKYYYSGINLNYVVLHGTYKDILFQVKKFVEEAEYLRPMMPFMYDGVVVSYLDKHKVARLGRQNSVNKYSIAIKFNAIKKQTIFTGYSYTIGQNGLITPMIHYLPVEFYGTIHTKSSGHSLKRFNELKLAPGDTIVVQYTNDVMPYVTKPDIEANRCNPNPPIEFIDTCPCCGTKLISSDSGKSVYCPNLNCGERNFTRMSNFLAKLRFKDFSKQTIVALAIDSFKSLIEISKCPDIVKERLGDVNGWKFILQVNELLSEPRYDYEIIGSLGFSSVAIAKWKLIFKAINIEQLIELPDNTLRKILLNIKGIGPGIADTIITERPYFIDDIRLIDYWFNIMEYKSNTDRTIKIRFTGFRDQSLVDSIKSQYPNVDIGEGAVTKDTNILLVPAEGYSSTKTIKASKDGVQIVPVKEFVDNLCKFLQ